MSRVSRGVAVLPYTASDDEAMRRWTFLSHTIGVHHMESITADSHTGIKEGLADSHESSR